MEPNVLDIVLMAFGAFLLLELGEFLWTLCQPEPVEHGTAPTAVQEAQSQDRVSDDGPAEDRSPPQSRNSRLDPHSWTVAAQQTTSETAPRYADPKDTGFYLAQRGWEQVSSSPERYAGQYQAGDVTMTGGLERTASGRQKFYVHDPPPAFAHEGNCLVPREDLASGTFEVHFDKAPGAFGDGIDLIETMLEETHA